MTSTSFSDLDVRHVHGPPGSGKTERAMREVQELLERGDSPDSLGFTTYTKAAVRTFQDRVAASTGLRTRNELPYVGTIHSLCFRLLGLTRSQVVTPQEWAKFCKAHELEYETVPWELEQALMEPTDVGQKDADQLRSFYDRYRTIGAVDIEAEWETYRWHQGRPSLTRLQQFIANYDAFRAEEGLFDFTDMLTAVLEEGVMPSARQWVVDEAQDLNPLQLEVLWFWLRSAKSVLFFSDINQTVYSFAGSDPTWLLNLPVTEDLHKSRRVPRRPRDLAVKLISRNRQRHSVLFEARDSEGELARTWHHPETVVEEFALNGETTGVLVRNRYLLRPWVNALRRAGLPFRNLRGFSPIRDTPKGARVALKIAYKQEVSFRELHQLFLEVPQKDWLPRGVKAKIERMAKQDESPWLALADILALTGADKLVQMLTNVRTCLQPLRAPAGEWKHYLVDLVRRFGLDVLTQEEPITLSTIHGAKGMQFNHVYLSTDMSKRTWKGSQEDDQAERRVFYVGLTRCSDSLHLLRSSRAYHYQEII